MSPLQVPGLGTLHGGEVFASSSNRSPGYDTSYNNLGPRIGIAYQPVEKTVIRAGYGIYYSAVRFGAAGTGAVGYQGYDENTPWINTYPDYFNGAWAWSSFVLAYVEQAPLYRALARDTAGPKSKSMSHSSGV